MSRRSQGAVFYRGGRGLSLTELHLKPDGLYDDDRDKPGGRDNFTLFGAVLVLALIGITIGLGLKMLPVTVAGIACTLLAMVVNRLPYIQVTETEVILREVFATQSVARSEVFWASTRLVNKTTTGRRPITTQYQLLLLMGKDGRCLGSISQLQFGMTALDEVVALLGIPKTDPNKRNAALAQPGGAATVDIDYEPNDPSRRDRHGGVNLKQLAREVPRSSSLVSRSILGIYSVILILPVACICVLVVTAAMQN